MPDAGLQLMPAASGRPEAPDDLLERWIAEHGDRIRRLAYRLLGWSGEVDDVVQQVFVQAFEHRERFRGDAAVATWLVRIAINVCRSHRRRDLLRWKTLTGWWQSRGAPDAVASDRESELEDRALRIRQAVGRLPANQREVVVLRYFEEMPLEEVARALGLRRNVVEVRLHRARAGLRDVLADVWQE